MSKKIIHIFGASGSGTSTLGKMIRDKKGYFWMDTDDYFWLPTNPPYTRKRDVNERLVLIKRIFSKWDKIVISGSLTDWGDELIPYFTLAVRIETPTDIRMERLRQRERTRFGSRIDVGGDMYEHHLEFIEWAAAYDTGGIDMRSKVKHDEWQKLLMCRVIEVDGSRKLEENFENIRAYL